MKHFLPAALLLVCVVLIAQGVAATKDSFDLQINGKIFKTGDTIRTEDLKGLANLQLVNIKTKQQYTPLAFEWVVSLESEISKNQSTNQDNWKRLPDLLNRVDKSSLVFIDNIKLDIPGIGPLPTYNLIPK